ncbi:Glycosylphosphatidylinositol-anchor biosynthesis 18 [Hyphodiscus hymeniophilus]|uniref:GPI mannosyltransferase 2 n=1 Tax=Hyphodiscus hymeniophilus TaxID=353542 RepID=A0A9P6VIK7_9HELO|nr:Glycosylphosphatidylinositol-anchor biosynthesis 18 [Hyphodiscus hymeniophilus]
MPSRISLSNHPKRTLLLTFLAWKSLLLIIAFASPGPGYDTSASLTEPAPDSAGELPVVLRYLVEKLTRWDAIYFTKVASRGYVFEQEWAWGWGWTRAIALSIGMLGVPHYEGLEAVAGIAIAHVAHLLSVFVIFALGATVFPNHPSKLALSLSAALLHTVFPAGLFLSAPYAESSCALLSFSGVLLFAKSFTPKGQSTSWHDLLLILSGLIFGIATTFRSNGILNGLLLLEEAFRVLLSLKDGFRLTTLRRLLATGLGGLIVGAGFVMPQYIAWSEYCADANADTTTLRPWCQKTIPSVYSFVQEHYWNVGLFRYWTIPNVPLFLLAAPMIALMTVSGIWALTYRINDKYPPSELQKKINNVGIERFPILRNLAVSQLMLTCLTFTSAHVQIITRISSAYPVCLWYLAAQLRKESSLARNVVRYMVIYAVVQGGLFASFLPPA